LAYRLGGNFGLEAVLTGLPGVRFEPYAIDFAGRHEIGPYMKQTHFWKMVRKESGAIISSP
jgi:hypothetical protein